MRILVLGDGEHLRRFWHLSEHELCFSPESKEIFALAVIFPGTEKTLQSIRCQTLLLWEDRAEDWIRSIAAEQVVSCGFSPRNSLTPASTEPGHSVITVQRELRRMDGSYIWPQDIPLPETWADISLPLQMMLTGMRLLGALS